MGREKRSLFWGSPAPPSTLLAPHPTRLPSLPQQLLVKEAARGAKTPLGRQGGRGEKVLSPELFGELGSGAQRGEEAPGELSSSSSPFSPWLTRFSPPL